MFVTVRALGALSLLALGLAGCSSDAASPEPAAPSGGPKPGYSIVTTCGMVTDIVRQVAGDRAVVTGLLGEGVDPHLYKPTFADVSLLMEADVVFYSGLHLEGQMQHAFDEISGDKPVHAVTEGLDKDYLRYPSEFEGSPDPHVWMDVAAWSRCVTFVGETLAAYDPPHAEEYRARATAYAGELTQLDGYVREVIGSIPEPQRQLVTAHDAFGYFARAYGLGVHSVQGISTESEPGVDDINSLVAFLVDQKIPAVFVEASVNQRNIDAVIEGAAQRGWSVRKAAVLYSDSMGDAGTYPGTYIGMIDHNATAIARSLGGEAPVGGMQGQLPPAE